MTNINTDPYSKRRENREKDPVVPVLRKMEVNDTYSWPVKRRYVVNSLKRQVEVLEDKKFIQHSFEDRVYVTRIK